MRDRDLFTFTRSILKDNKRIIYYLKKRDNDYLF